jgi:DHA2 family multidrug resistance protein-like MFS transporter
MIRAIYPARQLGRGLGVNSVIVSSSAALAPTLGGLILAVAPWPWVFAAAVPFAGASLLLGRALPDPRPRAEPYDIPAALLSAATFGLVISGLESGVHGSSPVVAAAIVLTGVAIGVLFVRRELREPRPILPVDLLARPLFALSTLGALAAFVASMTLLVALPFRLQQSYHFTPTEVGAMIAPWPLTTLFVAPASGALSDRVPAGILGGIGMAIASAAQLLLAWLPPHVGHIDVGWRMALTGAGFGMFLSPNARIQIGSAPRERAASAGGLISTTRLTGQTLGATLAAALLAYGRVDRTPALVGAGLALLAGLCSLARLRPAIRKPAPIELPDV